MIAKLAVLVLLLMPVAGLHAGVIYKCDSGDGVASYSSKRIKGANCKVVERYSSSRHARVARPETAAPATPSITPATATASPATHAVTPSPPAREATPVFTPAAVRSEPPRVVHGKVYAYIDGNGVRNYTSVRPAGVAAAAVRTIHYSYIKTCYACGALPGVNFGTVRLNTTAFQDAIAAAAHANGVEEAVVRAIIHAESAYNPNALSRVGAQGLMQLMPATAQRFGVVNAFDAADNIRGGVAYLAWLLKRFDGNLALAAAGYNAGEGAVAKYGGVPPYSETQRYVRRVAQLAERYRAALSQTAPGGLSAR